ncbi:MAG: SH3 domain-containing protein [Desulfuromonadaceae bacterium]|nr:SH3 domain-containing protein [Desulfuromonadaceae bacterium]MDD2849134.1 SH3 domain-containing protein [Desulfuromonadaceae bacterium]MDD4129502.1 SH3 domain-containing protein [Desulfuromonadaceae bacterium]
MRMARSLVVVMALMLCTSLAMAEEKRWVSSEGTTLKAEASATSENVADVLVGTEVTLVESGGRWLKVRTAAGKEGWVYAGRVSDTPPAAEVAGDDGGIFGGTMQKSQISTAKADSARSIRGLSPGATQYAKDRGTPEMYKKSLDVVLARKVSPKELKAFLQAGKIGEYAQANGGGK